MIRIRLRPLRLFGDPSISRRILSVVGSACAVALIVAIQSRRGAEIELTELSRADGAERARLVRGIAAAEAAIWRSSALARPGAFYGLDRRKRSGDAEFPVVLPGKGTGTLFRRTSRGIVEIAYAPRRDGFAASSRLWDRAIEARLERATGTKVEWLFGAASSGSPGVGEDRFAAADHLPSPAGEPPVIRRLSANAPVLAGYRIAMLRNEGVLLLLIALILVGMGGLIGRMVGSPLRRMARAVEASDIEPIQALLEDRSEIGQQARLIESWLLMRSELVHTNEWLEREVGARTGELDEAYTATIAALVSALEYRDQETRGHCDRVTEMAETIARALDLTEGQILELRRGALLHDIGKIAVPDGILLKPGELSAAERQMMQTHAEIGWEMLRDIRFLGGALDVPRYHHERWDGSGYPHGIAGEEIPLYARIFALVDVWDALSTDRPYRRAWPPERVRAHIRAGNGTEFDPMVVAAFESLPLDAFPSGWRAEADPLAA